MKGMTIKMRLSKQETEYFNNCAQEILSNADVQQMRNFIQHGSTSCLEHSIAVARGSYRLCRWLRISVDYRSLIRGALLHDFFLYDWHYKNGRKGLHGFTHPKTALINAGRLFALNERERDIILKHMWPLTIIPPKCKEAYLICLLDKYCSVKETLL